MPDRILQAVAIRRDFFQGVDTRDELHDLIASYARANLYDPVNSSANSRQVRRLTRDISRLMSQEFLPEAQEVAKASAEPILERMGGEKLVAKADKLTGQALSTFSLYHKRNLQAFLVELRNDSGGLSGEIEAEFARAFRDGRAKKQLVTDLVNSNQEAMARLDVVNAEIDTAAEQLARAEARLARTSKRGRTRARRDVRKAKSNLTKAEAKASTSQDALSRFENKVQGHARDTIRREADAAQTAHFEQAGFHTFVWVTVNSGEACGQCQDRHGRVMTSAEIRSDGPGRGGTWCQASCMCMMVPQEYKKIDAPLDLQGQV